MKRMLKDYFIPHEGNEHKPHFFGWENTIFILCVALFLEILFLINIFWILPRTHYAASILPGVMINLTNRERVESGGQALRTNETLARAAQMKAEDMARRGYFSHESPSGELPWEWFEKVQYDFTHAGENLAINFVDSEDVVAAWMRSETHKRNIVNGSFTEIGIGVAKGKYQGRDAVFVVQFFGTPRAKAASPVPAKSETTPNTTPSKTESSENIENKNISPSVSIPELKKGFQGLLGEFLSAPHTLVTGIYALLGTMIMLAVLLMIFVKIKIQHPRLIVNGAVMLLMMGSLIMLNHYLTQSQIIIF
jgi:hypothetical protein